MPSGSSSRSTRASTTVPTGISTKFTNGDIATRRRLRSGAVICATSSPQFHRQHARHDKDKHRLLPTTEPGSLVPRLTGSTYRPPLA